MKTGDLVRARHFIGVITEVIERRTPSGAVWKEEYRVCWNDGDISYESEDTIVLLTKTDKNCP